MAFEQVFIASSIQTFVATGTFLYLYHVTDPEKTRTIKTCWLIAALISLIYGFVVIEKGFNALETFNPGANGTFLESLSQIMMTSVMWIFILLIWYLVIRVMLDALMSVYKSVTERPKDYKG